MTSYLCRNTIILHDAVEYFLFTYSVLLQSAITYKDLSGIKLVHKNLLFIFSFLVSLFTCCAANSSILGVHTVINGSVGAVNQSALCASTSDIIQEDGNSSLAIESIAIGNCI